MFLFIPSTFQVIDGKVDDEDSYKLISEFGSHSGVASTTRANLSEDWSLKSVTLAVFEQHLPLILKLRHLIHSCQVYQCLH